MDQMLENQVSDEVDDEEGGVECEDDVDCILQDDMMVEEGVAYMVAEEVVVEDNNYLYHFSHRGEKG